MAEKVKLALITESGEVLDTTGPMEPQEFNDARDGAGAWALLMELRKAPVDE